MQHLPELHSSDAVARRHPSQHHHGATHLRGPTTSSSSRLSDGATLLEMNLVALEKGETPLMLQTQI